MEQDLAQGAEIAEKIDRRADELLLIARENVKRSDALLQKLQETNRSERGASPTELQHETEPAVVVFTRPESLATDHATPLLSDPDVAAGDAAEEDSVLMGSPSTPRSRADEEVLSSGASSPDEQIVAEAAPFKRPVERDTAADQALLFQDLASLEAACEGAESSASPRPAGEAKAAGSVAEVEQTPPTVTGAPAKTLPTSPLPATRWQRLVGVFSRVSNSVLGLLSWIWAQLRFSPRGG